MHTPGPWEIHKCTNGRIIFPEGNGDRGNVAHVYAKGDHDYNNNTYSSPDEMDANASLIAAAPDLLQSLGCALTLITKHGLAERLAAEHPEQYEMLQYARAAIDNATGGSGQ